MPYKRSDGKVFGSGSGTSTIIMDPEHLTYTRTIVFSDLSTPVDESYVHDKLMNLPGFPINVNSGTYSQTLNENPLRVHYFKELEAKNVGIFLTFNDNDILHGDVYVPCGAATLSSLKSSHKSLRGSI